MIRVILFGIRSFQLKILANVGCRPSSMIGQDCPCASITHTKKQYIRGVQYHELEIKEL